MTPTLELLHQAFGAYQAGEIGAEHLLATLEELADIVTGYLQELEACADDEPGYHQLVEAFDEHLEALEWLADNLDQPAEGLTRIEAAVARMVEAQHSLEEVTRVLCPRCAQPNPVGSPRCGSCSVQLPSWHAPRRSTVSLSESAPPEPELLTEDFVRVATALERWRQGSGREAFEKTVEAVRSSLERQRDRSGGGSGAASGTGGGAVGGARAGADSPVGRNCASTATVASTTTTSLVRMLEPSPSCRRIFPGQGRSRPDGNAVGQERSPGFEF